MTNDTRAASLSQTMGRAPALRGRIVEALRHFGDMTADETAEVLSETVLDIRPRFTELLDQKAIHKTEARRTNESGRSAVVWSLNAAGQEARAA